MHLFDKCCVNEGAPHVPVYYPTEEEFLDFSKYIARIERDCNDRFGIVKVVPPNVAAIQAEVNGRHLVMGVATPEEANHAIDDGLPF